MTSSSLRRGLGSILAATAMIALGAAWSRPSAQGVQVAQAGTRRAIDSLTVHDLPIHEVATQTAGSTMAILISGDGGWASSDRALADALVARGVPVVGFDSRAYLMNGRTADALGSVLRRLMQHYLAAWQRPDVIVIGYSRGAELVPFMVSRLPNDLRRHVTLVSLLGPAELTSFHFHWIDLVRPQARGANIPVRPEIEKLRGMPMQCIYGREDTEAICPTLTPGLAQSIGQERGHRVMAPDAAWVAARILEGVRRE